jgi:hypothetical protein
MSIRNHVKGSRTAEKLRNQGNREKQQTIPCLSPAPQEGEGKLKTSHGKPDGLGDRPAF